MKNALRCGTALTAVTSCLATISSAEAQVALELGGYMQQYFTYIDIDASSGIGSSEDAFSGFDVKSNTEIYFVGSATLDNGLKFGVNIQLEGNSNPSDQIDESYLFVEGVFGRFNLGSENSAGYLMTVAAPDVGIGINSTTIITNFIPDEGAFAGAGFNRSPLESTYVELDRNNDSEKLTYFTPRFHGFQFGASYIPDPNQDDNAQVDKRTVSFRNGFSFGGNFEDSFEGIDVAVSGRYDFADDESPSGSDPSLWAVGLNLGYAGFTIGGSYANTDEMGPDTGRAFDAGISYETGPWAASFTYLNGRAEASAAPGDSKFRAYEGAASYTLGPGIAVIGSVLYLDLEADTGEESQSLAFTTGFQLTF